MVEETLDNLPTADGTPEKKEEGNALDAHLAEIDNSNAEEHEDEGLRGRHDIPMQDYESMSLEQLVHGLEKLVTHEHVSSIREHVEHIKKSFLRQYREFIDEKREAHEADENLANTPFEYHLPAKDLFDKYYQQYREKRAELAKNQQNKLKTNLEVREQIIEELKTLIDPQVAIKDTWQHFNELRERWRNAGPIPRDKYNHVWNNYHFHVENFYDYIHLDREARDSEFKHNLELKLKIIQRVEELLNETDLIKAFRELQDLHRLWKEEIGPVSREHREEIWQKFSALTKQMHDKRESYYEELRKLEHKNLEAKRTLIQELEKLCQMEVHTHNQWQQLMKNAEQIRELFMQIGKVPSENVDETWGGFKKALREFNANKNAFYKNIKREQNENLLKKQALIAKAKEWMDSDDFESATPILKQIQEDWKKIGHVPKKLSDPLWDEFKKACNHFFDRLKSARSGQNSEEIEAFDRKKAYIDVVKAFEFSGDHKTDLEAIKEHIEHWKGLGRVPQSRRHIEGKFNKVLDGLFEKLSLSKKESEMIRFASRLEELAEGDDQRKIENEKIFIQRKIDELQSEIFQLENNIQFFSNQTKDNPLIKEVKKNIERHKEELKVWRDKLKQLKNL